MVCYVSGPDVHGKLQSYMCWCAITPIRQMTAVSEAGMTTSSYGAENTREIRGVGYSPYVTMLLLGEISTN